MNFQIPRFNLKSFFSKESHIFLILLIAFHVFLNVYWQRINTAPPTWDSAGHLVLSYIFADRYVPLLTGKLALTEFIKTSSYYPPLVHMLGGLTVLIFGRSFEVIILLGTLFFAISIIYLYKILSHFFPDNDKLPVLAVLIFSFFPGVWEQSRQFHLDVPVVALLLGAFYHLTLSEQLTNKKHSVFFFIFFTLAQLTKWYGFVFLIVPFVQSVVVPVWNSKDFSNTVRLKNILIGSALILVFALPWYVLNLKSLRENISVAATADAGDPVQTLSYESIFHYLKLVTSHQIGFLSVILVLMGLYYSFRKNELFAKYGLYLMLLPYIVFTLIQNKDLRYVLPLAPIFAFYIAYLLLLGGTKTYFTKAGLYASYLILIFFFFSFNQYQKLPDNLRFIATAFAGPAYEGAWIYEPYSYSYNSNDWRGNEIVQKINELAEKESAITGLYQVLELSDNRFYSIASFDLYKVQNAFHDMKIVVPYYRFNPFTPEELQDYLSEMHFALVPTDPGPPGLRNIAVLNQLVSYFNSEQNKEFVLVEQFFMPDGNRLDLYKKTNLATFINPGVNPESLRIYLADILFLDREPIGGTTFDTILYGSDGSQRTVNFAPEAGNQKRIPLEGIEKIQISLPPDRQNIVEIRGWIFKDGFFTRDPSYTKVIADSANQYLYKNFRIIPKSQASTFNTNTDVDIVYSASGIKVTLLSRDQSAYVAYATTGWQWNSVLLNDGTPEVTIPTEGLIQLEVSQKNILIKDFTQNWGYFLCYKGDAVCFYPLVEGL